MKKLQRASLDELAQKMPVICEKESTGYIGGDFYFRSGNYDAINCVEDNYSGDEIRMLTTDINTFINASAYNKKYNYSVGLNHHSVHFNSVQIIISNMLYGHSRIKDVINVTGGIGSFVVDPATGILGGNFNLGDGTTGSYASVPDITKVSLAVGVTPHLRVSDFDKSISKVLGGSSHLNPRRFEYGPARALWKIDSW